MKFNVYYILLFLKKYQMIFKICIEFNKRLTYKYINNQIKSK